jgi:hypothetical protein
MQAPRSASKEKRGEVGDVIGRKRVEKTGDGVVLVGEGGVGGGVLHGEGGSSG